MPDISERPYFCKYFSTYFMPNPYNNYVTNADDCENKDRPGMVCYSCSQYLNPPKQKNSENQTTEKIQDVKMSEKSKNPQIKSGHCLYQDVDVVFSGYNNNGKCGCLKCKRKKCDLECRAFKSGCDRVNAQEFSKHACMCNECITNTIYVNQQNQK
jgi:hypothetical protein